MAKLIDFIKGFKSGISWECSVLGDGTDLCMGTGKIKKFYIKHAQGRDWETEVHNTQTHAKEYGWFDNKEEAVKWCNERN